MHISRIYLDWTNDGPQKEYIHGFFDIDILLLRLLNKYYVGPKIKQISIHFYGKREFDLYPVLEKDSIKYLGGYIHYTACLDNISFNNLNRNEQVKYLWELIKLYVTRAAVYKKNYKLEQAMIEAYNEGVRLHYIADYNLIEEILIVNEVEYIGAVRVMFEVETMKAIFVLTYNGITKFQKDLLEVSKGNEYFLEMFKGICIESQNIVIKGRLDAKMFPIKIPFQLAGL